MNKLTQNFSGGTE